MQVGIFGGTFDPIHIGHLILAEHARQELGLEEVVFVPTFRPPHKRPAEADAKHRLAMARLATSENEFFAVSSLELDRQGPSYTVDTIRELDKLGLTKGRNACILIGGDSLRDFRTWKDWQDIAELCSIVVIPRAGVPLEGPDEVMQKVVIESM